MISSPRLDVLAIGNAIVDIIADADDAFLEREGLTKGMMRLIDADEAVRLYDHMGPAREISGGSAGNTAAGVAALGGKAGFIGQVAPDQLGEGVVVGGFRTPQRLDRSVDRAGERDPFTDDRRGAAGTRRGEWHGTRVVLKSSSAPRPETHVRRRAPRWWRCRA